MVASDHPSPASEVGVVALDRRHDGVALVTLDRPKMNALSVAFLGRLGDVVAELAADPPGAVVLWGGPRLFAAGADVGEFREPDAAPRIAAAFHAVTSALGALPRVTIAAITGYALGGGLELALACDLRVVAEDARLGQPEILLGIVPGGGATQRLPRLVGVSRAKDLIYTGRHVRADEALRIGLADRVVPRDDVLDEAVSLAASFAAGPLQALAAAKRVIDDGIDVPLADALALEVDAFVEVSHTEDAGLGVTSFLEHGPGRARFVGR
jgi:enoyl-CoA hydratase/carnithine racemase